MYKVISIAVLSFLSANLCQAAPIPLSEILSTPAGRWLALELGLVHNQATFTTRTQKLLEEAFTSIRSRYRRTVSGRDGSFHAGIAGEFAEENAVVLSLIAKEELASASQFVDGGAETFYVTRENFFPRIEGAPSARRLGRFKGPQGYELTVLERKAPTSGPAGMRLTWGEKAYARLLRSFGVRSITAGTIAIPEVKALNQYVEQLNQALLRDLKPRIPVTFVERRTSSPKILAKMLSRGEVPIYLGAEHVAKDPLVMLGSIVVTDAQLAILRADVVFLERFETVFLTNAAEGTVSAQTRKAFEEVWEMLGRRIGGAPELHQAGRSGISSLRSIGLDLSNGGELGWTSTRHKSPLERIVDLFEGAPAITHDPFELQRFRRALESFAEGSGRGHNQSLPGLTKPQARDAFSKRLSDIDRAAETIDGLGR